MSHIEIEPPHPQAGGHGKSRPLDYVFSIAAMIVAISSLGIASFEAYTRHEHEKISVWPRISVYSTDADNRYTFNVSNVGLGPAIIRSFDLQIDGKPVTDLKQLRQAIGTDLTDTPALYGSFGYGSVVLPGAHFSVLQIGPGPGVLPFHREINRRMRGSVCYCSLYEDCWILDESNPTPDPKPVEACPASRGFGM